jgi:large subunit ribosomal protein L4
MSEITVDILSGTGNKTKQVTLPGEVFGCEVNVPLIHQVVVAQLAAARQGTHATKTRGQVSGGGAKPWRQKGTGRARHGSRRAPQWTGGGAAHGPQPRSYAQRTPKKMIAAALRSALSDRVADGRLFILDNLVDAEVPSTKQALEALSVIGDYTSALVVLHRDEDAAWLSLRNVVNVHALAVDQINVYDVVVNQMLVFTKPALDEFVTRFGITELVEKAIPGAKAKAAPKAKAAAKVEDDAAKVEDEVPATDEAPAKAKAEPKAKAAPKAEVVEDEVPKAKAPAKKAAPKTAKAETTDTEAKK